MERLPLQPELLRRGAGSILLTSIPDRHGRDFLASAITNCGASARSPPPNRVPVHRPPRFISPSSREALK